MFVYLDNICFLVCLHQLLNLWDIKDQISTATVGRVVETTDTSNLMDKQVRLVQS
jgi:hypothetical protein